MATDIHQPTDMGFTELAEKPLPDRQDIEFLLSQAFDVLNDLEYEDLTSYVKINESTGIRQIMYALPNRIADSSLIISALGQRLPTRFGERLPEGVVAVVSQFPEGTTGFVGPFVWVNDGSVSRIIYGKEMNVVYKSQGYPENLFAEIYIQEPFRGKGMPFRPTDKIGDFVGEELASGAIRWGAVYLCVDKNGSWRLREYPDIPQDGDAVNLMWDFNPLNTETGQRGFRIPIYLRQQQALQQAITLVKPQENIGPSIIFRTDQATGQTDIIAFAPYLYLPNVGLLRDIAYKTPLPDGSIPKPDDLIIAAGDLHLVSNGKLGPILGGDEDAVKMAGGEVEEVNISGVRNHTGFYLGKAD